MAEYDVFRDEVVPLLKDCADNLSNLMSAHQQMSIFRQQDREAIQLMTRFEVQIESINKQFTLFLSSQGDYEKRQRELEIKVTKMLAYGGAVVTA